LKPLGATATSIEATDEQLVAMAQAGSSEAFATLFRRYRPAIGRYAGRMLGDDARAEDIVQEVFLSALRNIDTLDRPAGFRAWLYRIAHNTCVDHARRRGRAEEVSIDVNRLPASEEIRLFRQAPSSHSALTQKQDFKNLREAFGGLPPAQSEVLVMREFEGLSYDQIAARMGLTRASVESMLFRARQGLRNEYGEITTGARCLRMRPVMARMAEGLGGLRDRRAFVRHVRACDACRRDALAMGLGGPALESSVPGVRDALSRVAAVLPLPWFFTRRGDETGGGAASSAGGGGSTFASHAHNAITHLSSSVGMTSADQAATAFQKAVAVVAAVAVVGGGGYVATKGDRRGELLLKPDSTAVPARADIGVAVPPALAPLGGKPGGATGPIAAPGAPLGPGGPAALVTPLGAPGPAGVPGPLQLPGTPDAMAAPGAPLTGMPGDSTQGGTSNPDPSAGGGDTTVPTAGDTGSGTGTGTGTGTSGGDTGGDGTSGGGASGGGSTGGSDPDPTTQPGSGGVTPGPTSPTDPECQLPPGLDKKDKLPPGWEKKGCVAGATVEPVP
jgi:RNA polymerase sigma factor (sigma-70 family)